MSKERIVITGAAGFIGSHLCAYFLQKQYKVTGIDNFLTGYRENIQNLLPYQDFIFAECDITDFQKIEDIIQEGDIVLHHAALGSVPRSIEDPLKTHLNNATGFLNVALSCVRKKARRLIFASSSSVYGDSVKLPKTENETGMPLSPYAVSKISNELYAHVFGLNYGLEWIGLRYFNVFGENQRAGSAYAAVIPLFLEALINKKSPVIYGDGMQARDFTYVENVCFVNELAIKANSEACGKIYNIGCGEKTSVLDLFDLIRNELGKSDREILKIKPEFRPERKGDIRNSWADIRLAKSELGFFPKVQIKEGIERTVRAKLLEKHK
jgi:UDP-N-acetylglucosamine 4-epimerase